MAVMCGSASEGYIKDLSESEALRDREKVSVWVNDKDPGWIREDGESLWVWRPGMIIFLNLVHSEGEVWLSDPVHWEFIQGIVYFHGLLQQRGVLLHAAGVVRDGEAFLFPGVSGTGKSTIARLSRGLAVLSDENVPVRLPENGGPPEVYGSPFRSLGGIPGEKISAPLKGFYFPEHAQENRLVALTPRESLKRLLAIVISRTHWPPRLDR
jgi:hypothetical protein